MKLPKVAIVGRVNVGKSTLFNRIIKKPLAVVDDRPGVTRDRISKIVTWNDVAFELIDTGGFFPPEEDPLWDLVKNKIEETVRNSDLVIFLVDGKTGPTPYDTEISDWLRKLGKKVLLVANKTDVKTPYLEEFEVLGWGPPIQVSAAHGYGISELLDTVVEEVGGEKVSKNRRGKIPVTILGKPNVGKSSIFNALTGEDISIISDIPGTTRDSVDYETDEFIFVDTAGIKRKYSDEIEYYSHLRSLSSLNFADVAIVVIDISSEITNIDKKIISLAEKEGKGLVITLNKADLIKDRKPIFHHIARELGFVDYAPKILTSAKTGEGINYLKDAVKRVYEERKRFVSPEELENMLYEIFSRYTPPVELTFLKQVRENPPVFLLGAKGNLHQSFIKFIEKNIRQRFGFWGVPIEIKTKIVKKRRR